MSGIALPLPDLFARLALSCLLGLAVGLERARVGKEAGMRTHALVALGATLMTLVSGYAFANLPGRTDPTRIAAQIVTGIGFIGGGTILKEGVTVRGLTTAASLWTMAGVGMAIGAGLYVMALLAVVCALITLTIVTRLEQRVRLPAPQIWEVQLSLDSPAALDAILGYTHEKHLAAAVATYAASPTETTATLVVEVDRSWNAAALTTQLRSLGARSVRCSNRSAGDVLP
jgi:putative Mg2+ transporter-C (MgtC) family protein